MATDLVLYGPIEIPFVTRSDGITKRINPEQKAAFLRLVDEAGLSRKHGCYVFALRASKGYCPWYIGKATVSMRKECMHDHKLDKYNSVLFEGRKGTPMMFFVCPKDSLAKVPAKICDDIETFLIQSAIHENPDISNVQKTAVPEWSIKGVVRSGQGKPNALESSFRKMMGI
jgi:hypothetical protein